MGKKLAAVDDYIANAQPFARPVLRHLRRVVHAACPAVEEEMKWGHAHFAYKGMFCGMASFQKHITFGFWKHKLLMSGPNALPRVTQKAMGNFGRLTSVRDLPSVSALTAMIRRAASLNEARIKVAPKRPAAPRPAVMTPPYLMAVLRRNAKALATYQAFPPSQKREYVEWLTEAKTDATRARRLKTAVEWMSEGKVRNWKYARK